MRLSDINPFLRYAELQPSVLSAAPLSCSYDYRIFYILEGTAKFVLFDRVLPIRAGMLLYLRPGTPYFFDGKVKVIVLNFDMTRAGADQRTPRSPSRTLEDFDESLIFENQPPEELQEVILIENAFGIERRIKDCLLHYEYPTPVSEAMTSAIVKELLCFVVQQAARQSEGHGVAQKILLYIQQNYDKDISNVQISAKFGYHSFYLNRLFKKETGITIHQAVIGERMKIAKNLLIETELSVKDIASEVGYADLARFCTAFKAAVGATPLQYRKSLADAP